MTAKTLAPEVRTRFAKRLKNMRTQNGFLRARYFARALGIEENRYTRYERAEVEPNLTLIHRICEILRVSPNELLGFAAYGTPGMGEEQQAEYTTPSEREVDLLAWRLASEVTAVRNAQRANPGDPLSTTGETGKLFQQLKADPFNTVAGIVADEALRDLDAERRGSLARLVDAFTLSAGRTAPLAGA